MTLDRSGFVEFFDARGGAINTGNDRAISSGGSNEVQPRGFNIGVSLGTTIVETHLFHRLSTLFRYQPCSRRQIHVQCLLRP